jgi:hypothetical protein
MLLCQALIRRDEAGFSPERFRVRSYSHSMVAGGLLEMS